MADKFPLKTLLKISLTRVTDLSASTFMWTFEAIFIGKFELRSLCRSREIAVQIIIVVLSRKIVPPTTQNKDDVRGGFVGDGDNDATLRFTSHPET